MAHLYKNVIKIKEGHRAVLKSYHITIGITDQGNCAIIVSMIHNGENELSWLNSSSV